MIPSGSRKSQLFWTSITEEWMNEWNTLEAFVIKRKYFAQENRD